MRSSNVWAVGISYYANVRQKSSQILQVLKIMMSWRNTYVKVLNDVPYKP